MKEKSWIQEDLDSNESCLGWSADQQYLNYGGQRFPMHSVNRILLSVEEATIRKQKRAALIYPVKDQTVSILLCLEALYALIEQSKRKVLLVKKSIVVRESYRLLGVNELKINENFPLGVLRLDGSIKPQIKYSWQGKSPQKGCLFIHTSNPSILPDAELSQEIGCAVVDTSDIDPESIKNIIVWSEKNKIEALIFLESDFEMGNISIFRSAEIPVWSWNIEGLQADFEKDFQDVEKNPAKYENQFAFSAIQINNLLSGVKKTFVDIKDDQIDKILKESLQLYYGIKEILKNKPNEALSRAGIDYLRCKYAFERMLAPLEDIEKECNKSILAKTLRKRIESLKAWCAFLAKVDQDFLNFWGKTYAIADSLFEAFKNRGNPKYEKVKEIVKESFEKSNSLIIYNYSEPYARALLEALKRDFSMSEEELLQRKIRITSAIGEQDEKTYDCGIIFGQIPSKALWLIRNTLSKELIFLAYSSEKALLKQQIENEENRTQDLEKIDLREDFLKNILDIKELKRLPPKISKKRAPLAIHMNEEEVREEEKLKPVFKEIINEDDLATEEDSDIQDDEGEIQDTTVSADGSLIVKCCKIEFDDGKNIFFRRTRKLPIFKEGKTLEYLDVSKVKSGDLMILIKNNIRNNLAQEIIRKADNHPAMQRIKRLVNSWSAVLRRGLIENKDTLNSFLRKLNKLQEKSGRKKITNTLTIFLWKEGYTIGPQDPMNIKLIGEMYGDAFLIENYREIGAATRRLREIHQNLLREFNETVMMAGMKTIQNSADELIDEEFNFHLEDFTDVISIEKIKSVDLNSIAQKSKLDKIAK